MSGQFQLNQPFSGPGGYKPPANLLGDYKLRLDTSFVPGGLGWFAETRMGEVVNLGLTAPLGRDRALEAVLGPIAQDIAASPALDPRSLAASRMRAAPSTFWDAIIGLLRDKGYGLAREGGPELWRDATGPRRNIASGEAASVGKIDPSGLFRPTPADGVVAGTALDSGWLPFGTLSLGRRFLFVSSPDVHLYMYGDKDALGKRADLLLSGGGIGVEGKTGWGEDVKIQLGAGRDQSGGAAGFIKLQIGADYVPMSGHPAAPPPLF